MELCSLERSPSALSVAFEHFSGLLCPAVLVVYVLIIVTIGRYVDHLLVVGAQI